MNTIMRPMVATISRYWLLEAAHRSQRGTKSIRYIQK